jgi:endonuclease YncB( thermonuclease family)
MTKHLLAALLCWTVLAEGGGSAIDGDTFKTPLQIWPKLWIEETIRVLDVDTWELRAGDDRGDKAGEFTQNWIDKGPYSVYACKRDSFGRLLAVIKRGKKVLANELKKNGHEKK